MKDGQASKISWAPLFAQRDVVEQLTDCFTCGNFLFNKLATASNPAAFVGNTTRMARLRSLASDPADIDLLEAALKREAELFAQRGKALQGVSAAVKKAAQDDMSVALDTGDADLISAALRARNPGWFTGSALKVLMNKAKYPPEVVAKLTEVLNSGTPDEVAKTVVDLTAAAAAMAPKLRRQEITRDLAAVGAGMVAAGHGEPGEVAPRGTYSYEGAADEEAPADGTEPPPPPPPPTAEDEARGAPVSAPLAGEDPEFDNLANRVLRQESKGNPNAVSEKGAKGLMQVMGPTGVDPGLGVEPLRDDTPTENLRFGRDYLHALIDRYGGDKKLALMAYNWGLGKVDDWRAGKLKDSAIPAETRGYVKNILGVEV